MSQFHLLLVKLHSWLGDLPRQMQKPQEAGEVPWQSCLTELQLISQVAIRISNMGAELSVQAWRVTWLAY